MKKVKLAALVSALAATSVVFAQQTPPAKSPAQVAQTAKPGAARIEVAQGTPGGVSTGAVPSTVGTVGAVTTEGLVGLAAAVGVLGVTVSTGNKH